MYAEFNFLQVKCLWCDFIYRTPMLSTRSISQINCQCGNKIIVDGPKENIEVDKQ